MVCLPMVPRYTPYGGGSVIQWSIPNTCENPEKAMEALNYIYKNPEAAWIIEFGLEGEEYEVVKEEGDLKQIRWLADDIQSLPYYMPYGIWGNTLQWPVIEPSLNCGALDPEKALPEFLSALEAAGMDKILEEQQKQFDTWLAEQDK